MPDPSINLAIDDREAKPVTGPEDAPQQPAPASPGPRREIGGPTGPEPTRYGDWEKAGRCIDF